MIPNAKNTCALVVAVESCGMGTTWDLPGARVGAERFVKWLKREGVDPSRIYFPANPEVDDIRLVLQKLRDEQMGCDSLVLYWVGHGCETEKEDRCVFPADASEAIPKVLKIDNIISFFRSETPQFTSQLVIIDACATGWRSTKLTIEQIQTDDQLPQSPGDCRFVLSAPSGRETNYPDPDQPSLFSRHLLELLDQNGMTLGVLTGELQKDDAVFVRDGRSKYWSRSQAQSDAWTLEREVLRIGASLKLEPAKWRAEARRLDSTLDTQDASFQEIVEKISGWERGLAGKICAALLLRGAAAAQADDVKEAIRNSAPLAPSYRAAAEMVNNLRAFENSSYLIKTKYRQGDELGATGAWFFSGAEQCEPQRLKEWDPPAAFEDAICAITDHMDANDVPSQSVIEVVAPLHCLLKPQPDVLEHESNYALVFRERTRAEGLEGFRSMRPKFRDRLIEVKRRAAQEFKLEWFGTTNADKWTSVEFPALRTGNCADAEAEAHVERLLKTLAPFAAITRFSVRSLAAADEAALAQAIGNEKQFAKIPVRIQENRHKAGSILPHITVIWDDRELPKGYIH